MKTSRNLAWVGLVAFVISHFLPAYADGSGFACFGVCWKTLLGKDGDVLTGGWFYYSGLALSDILFPVLMVALFATKKGRKPRLAVSVIAALLVLSWLVLHVLQLPQIADIKIGYYVWLLAFGLLVAVHLRKEPGESLESIPPRVQSYKAESQP